MKAGSLKVTFDGLKKFAETVKVLALSDVLVGVPEVNGGRKEDDEHGEFNNAAIGYMNEFGSDLAGVPPRPHLSKGIQLKKQEITEELKQAAAKAFNDPSAVEKHYTRAGIIATMSVKNVITSQLEFTPLSETTLRMRREQGFKGESALIRTGQYRNSITFVIKGKK